MRTAGQLLRTAREQAKISLRKASVQVGVTPAYLSRIEREVSCSLPTAALICKLCDLYQVPPYPVLSAAKKVPDEVLQFLANRPNLLKILHQAARGNIEPNGALFDLVTKEQP